MQSLKLGMRQISMTTAMIQHCLKLSQKCDKTLETELCIAGDTAPRYFRHPLLPPISYLPLELVIPEMTPLSQFNLSTPKSYTTSFASHSCTRSKHVSFDSVKFRSKSLLCVGILLGTGDKRDNIRC